MTDEKYHLEQHFLLSLKIPFYKPEQEIFFFKCTHFLELKLTVAYINQNIYLADPEECLNPPDLVGIHQELPYSLQVHSCTRANKLL